MDHGPSLSQRAQLSHRCYNRKAITTAHLPMSLSVCSFVYAVVAVDIKTPFENVS